MRNLLGLATGAALLGGLSACGGGEEAFRNNMRSQGIANCQRGAAPEALAQVRELGTTVDALCTCAIDRYMRATSIEQLRQDRNNALPPALRNAMMQCMAEQVQRAGGGAAATVPAPLTAAPDRIQEDASRVIENARAQADRAADQARSAVENAQAELDKASRR